MTLYFPETEFDKFDLDLTLTGNELCRRME